jgi:hypothetical protein
MGTKRVGLARTQALIQGLKRELTLNNTTLINAAVRGVKEDTTGGGLVSGSITSPKTMVQHSNGSIITTFQIDLEGLSGSNAQPNSGAHQLVIGNAEAGVDGVAPAYMMEWKTETNGICYKIDLSCIEAPVGGAANATYVLSSSTLGVYEQGAAPTGDPTAVCSFGSAPISASQTLTVTQLDNSPADQEFLYLCTLSGSAGAGGKYTAGKLILTFHSYPDFT